MNILSYNKLSDKQIREVKELEKICLDTDGIEFSLFTEYELNEYADMPCFFMIYEEDMKELLAFLSLFVPGDGSAEVTACTHPDYRRKRYFHKLYNEACHVARQFDIDTMMFSINPLQAQALAVLKKYNAKLDNTEYLLKYAAGLLSNQIISCSTDFKDSYTLVPSTLEDIDTHINIFEEAFGYPHNAAIDFISEIFSSYTAAGFNNSNNNTVFSDSFIRAFSLKNITTNAIVGCCYADINNSQVMPFGICIHPNMQGMKLGQNMTAFLIEKYLLTYKKPILIQVSGSNENALHIYRKLGFKTASQLDCYTVSIV